MDQWIIEVIITKPHVFAAGSFQLSYSRAVQWIHHYVFQPENEFYLKCISEDEDLFGKRTYGYAERVMVFWEGIKIISKKCFFRFIKNVEQTGQLSNYLDEDIALLNNRLFTQGGK